VNRFFLGKGHMCLPQFGPAAGVVVAPDIKFVEVLVYNCFLISYGIHLLANRVFVEGVGSSGGH
jgi:hypothetical protein